MALEMKVPSPGESISEVEIAEWLVQDGDYVEKDQTVAEVDSDKATLELPAEASGIITLKAEEGDVVEVGEVVCLIDTEAEKPAGDTDSDKDSEKEKDNASSSDESKDKTEEQASSDKESEQKSASDEKKTYASGTPSPAAKKILDEKGVDAGDVKGTGRDGRITKDDAVKAEAKPSMGTPGSGSRGESRKKLSMLRRKVAERLVSAKNETAMLTTFNEVDMQPIFDLRKQYKDNFKEKHGVSLGFMSFFTLAVVRALDEYPSVNSMIDGKEMITYDYKDISIAVSGPKGLMVPVIRNAENLSFRGVEQEVKRLATRARDGKITVDEMTGGTFTISNGGVFGSMLSTPIINPPQSGILGMHNIVERPVAVDGEVKIRPIMYVALSYDHRIIDGKESVGFLVEVKKALENPEELLMDNNVKKALEL
ncbi:2-oxoglutarate dehydrogenase complex dihydrolipoyllysine-residue succinyltransferase [Mesohalobacter halotolerans]|jgi:2-oxoglutarate dehydrogenase E2 component (dihydrolipoamide succinyltransferase)|uniref:Dihydrolipoyllysine-residue succinyltransferase component of 2-oxoglutarate dehydrogenase complex n=1 Tax=Mesohalobacter halotolerans TaxID=1883405 RepID=A0A4U5TTL4_9FLAO|nr:2-oxoglutarate dehydrogenase complex dihydrolipoyllysine-residue succinyltransferase [Mesohalobacter halotolerans]MBS3737811.1 2-oxoglutarate dehydrogenase complex dihydrolipoyllysine-residue succinyltransferase [Psychroflexus sp.]NBC57092.1 2-oxoglutarate dehydrogenase complex dihydrolipoyllysine-residue succinyltransferase [Bacteroidota bacterium]TKS57211.1 2-oxoglutarate dehydrogenase complex dihydrolipoyllysine-residue succinyltransferase [Mesohalobacter halotolerans]